MSIKKNTIYNILGSGIPLITSLVTIPIYIRLIGEERYGILAIAWLLLGYFGLFDLGISRATARQIASQVDLEQKAIATTFWTALSINILLGTIGGLIIWPTSIYFFDSIFKYNDIYKNEIISAIPWLALALPLATVSGVLIGALQGKEKFLKINIISIFGTTIFQITPILSSYIFGASLDIILPTTVIARIITIAMLFNACRKHVIGNKQPVFDKNQAKNLLHFGGWVTISSFISPIMVILDRFIIGATIGAKSVGHYTLAFQITERITIIPSALSSALFPRLSSVDSENQEILSTKAIKTISIILTPIVVAGLLLMKPFLTLWVGAEIANKTNLAGQILLIGFYINSLAITPYVMLQARGRPDIVAKCHIFELLPYLAILYTLLINYGITGAAVAFTLRATLDYFLLYKLSRLHLKDMKSLIGPTLILIAIFTSSIKLINYNGSWELSVAIGITAALLWALASSPHVHIAQKKKST